MNILMVASEVDGFAKTGGLADVVSALSKSLVELGHDVKVVMPKYKCIEWDKLGKPKEHIKNLEVPVGDDHNEKCCAVYTADMPGTTEGKQVQVYFIEHEFYKRDGIYVDPNKKEDPKDYSDNPKRFTFLCMAALWLFREGDWQPGILHAHDWPTAMTAVYLKHNRQSLGKNFKKTASVLTIHNLGGAYQGCYDRSGNFEYMNLGIKFNDTGLEDDDGNKLNMLKAGLCCADKLNTVSRAYAEETTKEPQDRGLDKVLKSRKDDNDYRGILNGIDTNVWNPSTDSLLPARYSFKDMAGKVRAKEVLQRIFRLPVSKETPIIGMVLRLTEQKGIKELFWPNYGSAWQICNDMDIQMVVLGSDKKWCEDEIRALTLKLPNFRARIGFSEELAHLIEAGSDFFLMPSHYEPCGLNQMYSLNYGTIPIVRNTGGLKDSVKNYNMATGDGTGFIYNDPTPQAIYSIVDRAVWTWNVRPEHIEAMRLRGMKEDFSWKKSTQEYVEMYENALKKVQDNK